MRYLAVFLWLVLFSGSVSAEFRAGAVAVDVSPQEFPVLVNGGMASRSASQITDPVYARAVVLADAEIQLALVVVDSCMMGRPLLDQAKELASKKTGIPPHQMLISATHTHSAPSALACLGTEADPRYTLFLIQKLAEAIESAQQKLQPAQVGWASVDAPEFTAVRRWIRRPDRVDLDPFGNPTVRANMHAGRAWSDVTGESGPEDPELSMISFQTRDGKPLALLANFSMHYFSGAPPVSADYFGLFAGNLEQALGSDSDFVGILSHGCSGDIWRRDYTVRDWSVDAPSAGEEWDMVTYARELAQRALSAYETIEHESDVSLAMAERRVNLRYRTPNVQLLEWAQRKVQQMGGNPPKTQEEVYAHEQIYLHDRQETEICLQAVRIGEIAIATTPNETYALTGLKLKAMSPFPKTMVIELANGGDGYIPPPEQHVLGGYNTWAARSAGLEVLAEPKIVQLDLELLEEVTGKPRRAPKRSLGAAARAILDNDPVGYWRMDEFNGPFAWDVSGNDHHALYEEGVVFYLEGPQPEAFAEGEELNHAAHFCGGRLQIPMKKLGNDYTVSMWFWNGMPDQARNMAGWMLSRGEDHGSMNGSDHLGLSGDGRLVYRWDEKQRGLGRTVVSRWTWNKVMFVRADGLVRVYLNDNPEPEIELQTELPARLPERIFIGGSTAGVDNWEGRLDEVAVFGNAPSKGSTKF